MVNHGYILEEGADEPELVGADMREVEDLKRSGHNFAGYYETKYGPLVPRL